MVDLHSFLQQARDLHERAETLLPHAEGFRPALAGGILVPRYATAEDWEADFGESCRPWRDGDEPLTQPYAIAACHSVEAFLAANPHVVIKGSA